MQRTLAFEQALDEGIPIVDAYLLVPRRIHIVMLCLYCHAWHLHGNQGPDLGQGDGHRVAHCQIETPYRKTGYVL
jgi:hypothetical protein